MGHPDAALVNAAKANFDAVLSAVTHVPGALDRLAGRVSSGAEQEASSPSKPLVRSDWHRLAGRASLEGRLSALAGARSPQTPADPSRSRSRGNRLNRAPRSAAVPWIGLIIGPSLWEPEGHRAPVGKSCSSRPWRNLQAEQRRQGAGLRC
jgi:hypothetical protein